MPESAFLAVLFGCLVGLALALLLAGAGILLALCGAMRAGHAAIRGGTWVAVAVSGASVTLAVATVLVR